jgi:hypothetical protein
MNNVAGDMKESEILFQENDVSVIRNGHKIKCFYCDSEKRILLADIDTKNKVTKIHPTYTRAGHSKYLLPKYEGVNFIFEGYDINVEEHYTAPENIIVLSELPEIFIKTLSYGLGLKKEYKLIVELLNYIENCKTLLFSTEKRTGIEETKDKDNIIIINDNDIDKLRRGLDRTQDLYRQEALESKRLFVYNELLHNIDNKQFPEKKRKTKNNIIYKIIKEIDFAASISGSNKKVALEIKNDMDFNYFAALKIEFDKKIEEKQKEVVYQKFFEENPLLLTLFVGSPFVQFKNQAFVGGKSFDNKNGQYPDFLFKHKFTNNNFIIEIKCPNTPLLENTPYRETGIYSPSKELSGAISQVLTQKYQLETDIASLIKNAEDRDVEAYNVQGLVIIGLFSNFASEDTRAKRRSFELFRNNQKNLRIMTYDECQEQLKFFLMETSKQHNIEGSGKSAEQQEAPNA